MLTITIKLFGAFHDYFPQPQIHFELPKGSTIRQVRQMLATKLQQQDKATKAHELVHSSAFANETQIITDDIILLRDTLLAVLPPVCGG